MTTIEIIKSVTIKKKLKYITNKSKKYKSILPHRKRFFKVTGKETKKEITKTFKSRIFLKLVINIKKKKKENSKINIVYLKLFKNILSS